MVDPLPAGSVKTQLTALINKAQELLDKKTQAIAAAREAVNNLFTDGWHIALHEQTTQTTINAAKKVVDALPTSEVKTQLTALIKKAQDLLDKKNQEAAAAEKAAKEVVNNLFTDDTHAALNTKTTQAAITAAQKLVDALPTGEVKTQLTAEIKKAQALLDKKNQEDEAKETVNRLFSDGWHTALNSKTTQATIDAAKKVVNALPAGSVKTQLTAEINKAQDFLDKKNQEAAAEKAAQTVVNNLFTDDTHATLSVKTTQAIIDAAKKVVNALPAGEVRTQLTAEIKKAQELLDKKNQEAAAEKAAQAAVNNLFTNDSHTALKDNISQATIDAAKKVVEALPSGEVKTKLTTEINKAQKLLDKKNQETAAKEAVNNLFTDGSHTALNDQTTQATIDAAKKVVDTLPVGEVKTQLAVEINKAQELLDKKNQEAAAAEKAAESGVNNLFADEAHTTLNDNITQATIDAAKKEVDALPVGEVKTKLTAEIQKAQELLDKKNQEAAAAEKAAEAGVNNLFTDDSHIALNDQTTQATIDAAKKEVDALPVGEVKTKLSAEIQKAQELLDKKHQEEAAAAEKAAEAGVNSLFTDESHTVLNDKMTQATIDAAKKEVDALPAGEVKTKLSAEIQKAQELLDKKNQEVAAAEKAAEAGVNNLFTDDSHIALNDQTTKATIDAAQKLVDSLPTGEVKTKLSAEIKKAQDLLDKKHQEEAAAAEKAAQTAVDNLFTDDSHTALNNQTTQAAIDEAKKTVEALPKGEVKTQLTAEIKKAQDILLVNESKIDLNDYLIGIDRYVKGEIIGKAIKKIALQVNGELKKSVNVTTGSFQYWAVGQIMNDKDEVFVIGLDAYGNEIKRTKLNITPSNESEKVILTASSFVLGKDHYITGTYEGNVKTVALRIDGVLTQKIAVKDGVIKYYAKGKIKDSASKVELVAIDATGKEVAKQTIKISDVIASMTVDLYKIGEAYIQGTYTGDAKYMSIEVNGQRLQTIGIANGVLKYYAKGKIASANDKVTVILLDGNKTEIQRTPLKIVSTAGTLTLDSYKLNAAYLTGTYTGDVVKVRVLINDVAQRLIPVSGNKVQYYARNLITKETDTVIVEGLDASNNVLDSQTIEITK